jgi:selenium-binding protein 1
MSQMLDPTFYRTPADAIAAPPERLAYVAAYDPTGQAKDAITVLDTDPSSATYGQVVGWSELPTGGNELHHFGWNACSSALCHQGHGDHGTPLERRYLIVPGIRSSRTYVLDTKPDPRNPRVVRTIEADELAAKAGYSRPHTVHCGPGGIFMSALGGANGNDGPAGVALLDHDTFDVIGPWEQDRGDQYFGYDVWWHLNHDTLITSEWGTPSMVENGLDPEDLLGRRFGHHLNFWSMSERKLTQRVDLGDQHQMVLELRPAHDPSKTWGFSGAVISVEDLSASVFLWHRDGDRWAARKVVTIPAEPADPDQLPPALQPFGAVPPFITDIDLSVDDRWLYVSCWGTGELKQYDVSDPFHPRESGSVKLGGIVRRQPHPATPEVPLRGGPQMVEVSRDGRRVYVSNSLYAAWDDIFYPEGVGAWVAKLDATLDGGGLTPDVRFFPHGDEFRGLRVHQTRLEAGDASSDSYCYTS